MTSPSPRDSSELCDVLCMVALRLPSWLGCGPEPSASPLQPLAAKVSDALGDIATELSASITNDDLALAYGALRAMRRIADELADTLGHEHPLTAALDLAATYAHLRFAAP